MIKTIKLWLQAKRQSKQIVIDEDFIDFSYDNPWLGIQQDPEFN